jgi:hypothetical protein
MKQILSLALLLFICLSANAQDVITTRKGVVIQAKVTEVTTSEIKYKRFDNLDGPNYTAKKSEIASIVYKNGTIDAFGDAETTDSADLPTDFFVNLHGGLSAPIGSYQSFDSNNNNSGAAQTSFGLGLDVGGTFPRSNFGWLLTASSDKHYMDQSAVTSTTSGAATNVTGYYSHSGALLGVSYRVPIGTARSSLNFYAQLGYFFSTIPEIDNRVSDYYYGSAAGRRGGAGQGLGYNAGLSYRHHFSKSRFYVLAKINYQAATLNVTGAETYSESSSPWAGNVGSVQSVSFSYPYSVVNAQLGIGFFLK